MLTQVVTIARNAFVESIRQPIFFVMVMVCGLLQLFNTWTTAFSMGYTDSAEVSGDTKLLFDIGLATVFVCATLLAAFIATAVMSREIEQKTVLTVVSKPIPRAAVVVGKYLGVASALLVAVVIMLCFLLMGLRHGVLTAVSDEIDYPVIVLSIAAVAGAIAIATWCNFFYGWYFSQTCMLVLLPAIVGAYLLALALSKKWEWQPLTTDLKPQIIFACAGLTMAILVLASVATAVSTRLGQVMTVVACAGVFLFGLLANHLVGRHVFENSHIGVIKSATPEPTAPEGWTRPGERYTIAFETAPRTPPKVGDSFYYGPSPSGFPMAVREFPPFTGNVDDGPSLLGVNTLPGLVVTQLTSDGVVVRKTGQDPLAYEAPPRAGDFVFLQPTRVNLAALGVWAAVPNMHYFWLVDAVSQNQLIPYTHMGLLMAYGGLQILAFLAIGIALFQGRDVG